ncbi:biotin--[acetyl-CoA-carboxylase] ligase [Aureimonas sp. ME7]|uniref:biotin--[acetyl-CoA-carboxylase] ligase n=1 Tax=Aureimonas sp. ME7 TaxID=2744252 RepID=UPI0015F3F4C8|nr:biotin--[acetyl-CoA-carboxylase] ligase [Aureimonas sp. ME7]
MEKRPVGARRHLAFDDVASTNLVALEAARSGDPGPLWVTAAVQTAGRGRRGRVWQSERGNLYATLLLLDPAPDSEITNLPLVVALGVRNGLATLPGVDPDRVRIKWPNDVMVDGAKLVGILLESETVAPGRRAVVIGCGVNVELDFAGAAYPTTTLRSQGFKGTIDDVFSALASGVEAALEIWSSGRQFQVIRREWIRHSIGKGEPCRVTLPSGEAIEGRFADLDADGRLILEREGGERRVFSAGDLFFLRSASAVP